MANFYTEHFFTVNCIVKTKINKKRPGVPQEKNNKPLLRISLPEPFDDLKARPSSYKSTVVTVVPPSFEVILFKVNIHWPLFRFLN